MKTDWQMVRLDKATHARLVAFLNSAKVWKKKIIANSRHKVWQQPSLSDAIAELLDRVDNHKQRSKRSGRKRPAAAPEQPGPERVELPNGILHRPNAAQLAELFDAQAGDDVLDMEAG